MNSFRKGLLGNIEIIVHLQAKPEGRGITEVGAQAKSRVCRDASFPMNDLVDSARRNSKISAKLILADVHRFEEFFEQNLAWMYRRYSFHYSTLTIINNLTMVYISILPLKTKPPLIINADTVLSLSFPR